MQKLIRKHLVADFTAVIEKLNRKATKLNMPAISLTLGQEVAKEVNHYDSCTSPCSCIPFIRLYQEVSIEGLSPTISGYRLAAVLEHTEAGNIVRNVVDNLPEKYRTSLPTCDHCQKDRRRNETFVLIKDGQFIQIGRSCLADFLRSESYAEQLLNALSSWISISSFSDKKEDDNTLSSKPSVWSIDSILTLAAASVRERGFVSRKASEERGTEATSHLLYLVLVDRQKDVISVQEADKVTASAAKEWVLSINPDSDYLHNIQLIAKLGYVELKQLGYAASIIAAYNKATEKAKESADKPVSQFLGEVGQKLSVAVTLVREVVIESQWGVSSIYLFEDASGNKLVWKTNSVTLQEGDQIILSGRIKEHSEYRGINQTVLTRCKVTLP